MVLDTLQQGNMFTGEWETKRTSRTPLQQMPMFSVRETVSFGTSAHPRFAEGGRPTLVLTREDTRTPEEVERDLMREAEALTSPMFEGASSLESDNLPEPNPDEENQPQQPEHLKTSDSPTQLSCYLNLISLTREQAMTVWVDEPYRGRFYAQLPKAILAAQGVGLTASEISAAMQIGEFLGNKERETAEQRHGVNADAGRSQTSHPNPHKVPDGESSQGNFRARVRRDRVPLLRRSSHPKVSEIIPGLWTERDYIRKRLPHVHKGLSHISDDELTSLAENISEVLQDSYWRLLGIALQHQSLAAERQ